MGRGLGSGYCLGGRAERQYLWGHGEKWVGIKRTWYLVGESCK